MSALGEATVAGGGEEPAAGTALLVSVVVPVRDRAEELPPLVAALKAQTIGLDRFEVVVADDGSTEPLGLAFDGRWLRIESAPPANSYAARNRGVRAARAPVLAFCDGDCRPEPDWLERGLAALDEAPLVAGEVRPEAPARVTAWALLDADESLNQRRAVAEGHAVTANLFVRREVFERLDGFDENFPSGGDYDFVERAVAAGERLVLAPDAVVAHPTIHRARPFLRRWWFRSRTYARRAAEDDRGPRLAQLLWLVPVLGGMRMRLELGRPLGLDGARLRWGGIEPRPVAVAGALALRYLVLPYVSAAAQVVPRRRLRARA